MAEKQETVDKKSNETGLSVCLSDFGGENTTVIQESGKVENRHQDNMSAPNAVYTSSEDSLAHENEKDGIEDNDKLNKREFPLTNYPDNAENQRDESFRDNPLSSLVNTHLNSGNNTLPKEGPRGVLYSIDENVTHGKPFRDDNHSSGGRINKEENEIEDTGKVNIEDGRSMDGRLHQSNEEDFHEGTNISKNSDRVEETRLVNHDYSRRICPSAIDELCEEKGFMALKVCENDTIVQADKIANENKLVSLIECIDTSKNEEAKELASEIDKTNDRYFTNTLSDMCKSEEKIEIAAQRCTLDQRIRTKSAQIERLAWKSGKSDTSNFYHDTVKEEELKNLPEEKEILDVTCHGLKLSKIVHNRKSCKTAYFSSRQMTPNATATVDEARNTMGDHNLNTLEDALEYFDLLSDFQRLEESLENLRRHKTGKKAHEKHFKEVDKKIQKLSFRFHPDRVKNNGGSEVEIAEAQNLQTALNATRTVLNILNDIFLEDLLTDHKYGFYTKLNLSCLANEDEVKNHAYEVLFQIGLISEIKQQKIVAEIRSFLQESECSIHSYFNNDVANFEKHRDSAIFHLTCCIKGYESLDSELKKIQDECKAKKLDNIYSSISKMSDENSKELADLQNLNIFAKKSLTESLYMSTTSDKVDEYFVLPFVCYINVLLMCSVMVKDTTHHNRSYAFQLPLSQPPQIYCNDLPLTYPYMLALSYMGCKSYDHLLKYDISQEEIKTEFDCFLKTIYKYFKDMFCIRKYADRSSKSYFIEKLKECGTMKSEFKRREKELSEDIQKFKRKAEEMDEKYDKILNETDEFNKTVKQRLEKSKELTEKISIALLKPQTKM